MTRLVAVMVLLFSGSPGVMASDGPADGREVTDRGLAYLAREVPAWSVDHRCFSCHNNGDAARALFRGSAKGYRPVGEPLADTKGWLVRPRDWDRTADDDPFKDAQLARVAFAAALAEGVRSANLDGRAALIEAAGRLADDQEADGSWPSDEPGSIGSPATYGPALATWLASDTLRAAGSDRFAPMIRRADAWLLGEVRPINTPSASIRLLAAGLDPPGVDEAVGFLRRSQGRDGGWGPYAGSSAEAFDTALALLALARHRDRAEVEAMIGRGRASLIGSQRADGSWPETTRPAGRESYAQRVSTAGWAILALIETGPPVAGPKPGS